MEEFLAKKGETIFWFVWVLFVYIYSFSQFFEHPVCIRSHPGHLGHWLIKTKVLTFEVSSKWGE